MDRLCDWTGISLCLCFSFCVCVCGCVGVENSHDFGPSAPLEYISGGLSLWLTNARHKQTRKEQAVSGPVLKKTGEKNLNLSFGQWAVFCVQDFHSSDETWMV